RRGCVDGWRSAATAREGATPGAGASTVRPAPRTGTGDGNEALVEVDDIAVGTDGAVARVEGTTAPPPRHGAGAARRGRRRNPAPVGLERRRAGMGADGRPRGPPRRQAIPRTPDRPGPGGAAGRVAGRRRLRGAARGPP